MSAAREEAAATESLTAPAEDYLKAIYAIGRGSGAAATNEIAQRLAIAPASVSIGRDDEPRRRSAGPQLSHRPQWADSASPK